MISADKNVMCFAERFMPPPLHPNILSHADCFTPFVAHLRIGNEAAFGIKSGYGGVVFYVGVNGQETASTIIIVTADSFPHGGGYHKGTYAFVFFRE
jgi:hypothetical protein